MLYCSSGKCQIVHWRQGHKDECCPPIISEPLEKESNSNRDGILKTQSNVYGNGFKL